MTNVTLDYDLDQGYWFYYYYDSEGFKTIIEGFETSVLAKIHAEENVLDCETW